MKQATFDTVRVNALSDGVFAIAMTLLILDVKLPDVGSDLKPEVFVDTLKAQGPRFFSWILSFAILCRLQISQHSLLAGGETRSRAFLSWTFLFLAMVSFLPFSTSLLSEHHDQLLSVAIFSASLSVGGIALFGMVKCLLRQESIDASLSVDDGLARRAVIILLATAAVSTSVAFYSPPIGAAIWIAFPAIATLVEMRMQS